MYLRADFKSSHTIVQRVLRYKLINIREMLIDMVFFSSGTFTDFINHSFVFHCNAK